jgi:predicted ATP-grasp superfamily ATP-dependent carboligase
MTKPGAPGTLVVAGLSARALAQSARQGGWQVVALDLFGDQDTRAASIAWHSLAAQDDEAAGAGAGAALAIDPSRLRNALAQVARQPGVVGWVAGSGFDGCPEWLDAGAGHLPLLGMPAAAVAAVRNPRHFFTTLGRLGLAHPPVRFSAPGELAGWLVKGAGGTGGGQIWPAADRRPPPPQAYFQQRQAGEPMSALFVADGRHARLVALNRLLVAPQPARPYGYRGAIGPVRHPALQDRVESALAALVPAFGLRGLASLDFIACNDRPWLLEINPRPSASMALHAQAWPQGLLWAHLQGVGGRLPAAADEGSGLRGCETVCAPAGGCVGPALAQALAALPDCHDLPMPDAHLAPGDPLCSISAQAADEAALHHQLQARRRQIQHLLEPWRETV